LRVATVAEKEAARKYLLAAVIRVASEQEQIDQELGGHEQRRPITEFVSGPGCSARAVCRSTHRLIPNYSVEQALAAMKARGLLTRGSVRRVGDRRPGLGLRGQGGRFRYLSSTDAAAFCRAEFAQAAGSCALARRSEIVLLDISQRIIDHVTQARVRAARNIGYTLNLPLPGALRGSPTFARTGRRSAIRSAPRPSPGVEGD